MSVPPIRSPWPALLVAGLAACSQDVNISDKLNHRPAAAIQSPEDGATFTEIDAIEFVGAVDDPEGPGDLVTVDWASDVDGLLADIGSAAPDADGLSHFAANLSPGTHVVTLTVVDRGDLQAVTSVSVVVEAAAQVPVAEITLPAPFSIFDPGEDVQLVGAVSDPNQPPETLEATWSVEPAAGGDREVLFVGAPSAAGSTLATWIGPDVGRHRVWLSVVDDDGNVAEVSTTVEIADPNAGDADGDGWTVLAGDCDDSDPEVAPGLDESCDGKDNDCNGVIDDKDLDVDGHVDEACAQYPGALPIDDCDDLAGTVFPGAAEQADGLDNDCDGEIDDGLSVFDNDGDCYCTALTCTGSINSACVTLGIGDCDDNDPQLNPIDADGDGASTCAGDCNDFDPLLNPNDVDADGTSTCDGDCDDGDPWFNPDDVDNDGASTCEGDCDDGHAALNLHDNDADGASTCGGDCNDGSSVLNILDLDGDGWTSCDGDCNDADPLITPVDGDGDGESACEGDCDDTDAGLNVHDADGDGFSTCEADCDDADDTLDPADVDGDGTSTCGGDCDDLSAVLNVDDADGDGASSCDGDCNDASAALNLDDADGDGWSTCAGDCDDNDPNVSFDDNDGDGWSTCAGDCDDNDPGLNPADADSDGYSTCDGDCSDVTAAVHPGATEIPYNGLDDDCVGGDLVDVDGDGYPAIAAGGTDCNDNAAAVNPGAAEACNGIDDDCDTKIDENNATGCTTYYLDADNDGYGSTASRCQCAPNATSGYDVTDNTDCYDASADAHPGQTTYFYDHRGDGSWDYNCDGVERKQDARSAVYQCDDYLVVAFPPQWGCQFTQGWETSAPGCGETENWGGGCYYFPLVFCEPLDLTPVDQRCR
ncbi:MAG: putative metal-binding motif-containing protein [Myxococcota bacterium]